MSASTDFAIHHGSAGEGRCRHSTTAGYAHLADGHLVAAAKLVGRLIDDVMDGAAVHSTGDATG